MKRLLPITLILLPFFGMAQRKFYIGGLLSGQQFTMHVRDTGNELYPMRRTKPWPSFCGMQGGMRINRTLTLETGIQGVSYDETVPVKRYAYGSGGGIRGLNIPLTAIWNFRPLSVSRHTSFQFGLAAGVNFVSITNRKSAGGRMTTEDREHFYLDTHHSSSEGPAHFLLPYGGIRTELIFYNRVGLYWSLNHVLGHKEIFTNHVEYGIEGTKYTGEVAYTGGGKLTQFGLRYYFKKKVAGALQK